MSRHIVRDDDFQVVVGWDPPLHTYFVQVYDVKVFREALKSDPDADDAIVLWKGVSPGEVPTPEDAADLVREWVEVPPHLLVRLRQEKEG